MALMTLLSPHSVIHTRLPLNPRAPGGKENKASLLQESLTTANINQGPPLNVTNLNGFTREEGPPLIAATAGVRVNVFLKTAYRWSIFLFGERHLIAQV